SLCSGISQLTVAVCTFGFTVAFYRLFSGMGQERFQADEDFFLLCGATNLVCPRIALAANRKEILYACENESIFLNTFMQSPIEWLLTLASGTGTPSTASLPGD